MSNTKLLPRNSKLIKISFHKARNGNPGCISTELKAPGGGIDNLYTAMVSSYSNTVTAKDAVDIFRKLANIIESDMEN